MKRPMLLCGIAEENATANANATESMTITAIATVLPTETTLVEPKFRVGPTVTLHPINDVVDKSQNGLVELHMDNPSLNYVTFNPSFPPKNQNPNRMAACLRNFCYLLVVILNTLMISLYNCGSFFCVSSLKYNQVVDLPTSKVFISIEVYYLPELCHGYKTLITIQ